MIIRGIKPFVTSLRVAIIMTFFCLWACHAPSPAVPVKEFQKTARAQNTKYDHSQKMIEELKELSATTRNSVFTEEFGSPEYLIGPGDILELTFWEQTTPQKYETMVRQDGNISYSFLDDIPVSGLTARQVDEELTKRLARFIRNVRLDVTVKTFNSKGASLFGEVNILQTGKSGPGKYNLQGKTTILDLIVQAGGMTKDSDMKNVELIRKGRRYTLNLYKTMFQGDMQQNVVIDDNDVVTVPNLPKLSERVYVFGEVLKEGIYPYDDAFDLLAAIGQAGGATLTAVREDIKIIRGYENGETVVLSANLNDILDRGDISQNIPLQNGDVVYVPQSIIGDINDFITKTTPLLEYLFYPATYRDRYSDTQRLRYFMKN